MPFTFYHFTSTNTFLINHLPSGSSKNILYWDNKVIWQSEGSRMKDFVTSLRIYLGSWLHRTSNSVSSYTHYLSHQDTILLFWPRVQQYMDSKPQMRLKDW